MAALSCARVFQLGAAIPPLCLCGSNHLCIAAFHLERNRPDVGRGYRKGVAQIRALDVQVGGDGYWTSGRGRIGRC